MRLGRAPRAEVDSPGRNGGKGSTSQGAGNMAKVKWAQRKKYNYTE